MQILKQGNAHRHEAFEATCPNCNSELRIFVGDPHASRLYYNCDRRQYWIRYRCPVCETLQIAFTRSGFGGSFNAKYIPDYVLTQKDREDMNSWSCMCTTAEEEEWFSNSTAP